VFVTLLGANVLVFNEGRHVKLTDFGSSVKLSETSIKLQEGFTVHFAAPEVIKTGSASFSADIWSAMCCLIEMITGYLPWCFSQPLEYTSIVFIVGRYDDQNEDNFKLLVPYADLELNDETIHLFKLVFRNEPSSRPTARDLLNNPLIVEGMYISTHTHTDVHSFNL
jgi:serine/threonine protein kinase